MTIFNPRLAYIFVSELCKGLNPYQFQIRHPGCSPYGVEPKLKFLLKFLKAISPPEGANFIVNNTAIQDIYKVILDCYLIFCIDLPAFLSLTCVKVSLSPFVHKNPFGLKGHHLTSTGSHSVSLQAGTSFLFVTLLIVLCDLSRRFPDFHLCLSAKPSGCQPYPRPESLWAGRGWNQNLNSYQFDGFCVLIF